MFISVLAKGLPPLPPVLYPSIPFISLLGWKDDKDWFDCHTIKLFGNPGRKTISLPIQLSYCPGKIDFGDKWMIKKEYVCLYLSLLMDSNAICCFVFLWHTYRAGPHPTALLTFKFWRIGLRDVERLARHRDQARQALAHPRVRRRPLGDRKVRLQYIEKQVRIHDRDYRCAPWQMHACIVPDRGFVRKKTRLSK